MTFEQQLRLVRRVAFAGGDVNEALAQIEDQRLERISDAHPRIIRWMVDLANGDLPTKHRRAIKRCRPVK
jgi:hypothetical protein